MSNETKQDVFEYYLEMIKALKDPLAAETVREARQRYAAALPDDLPVIPFRVAEVIKTNQADTELTIVLMRAKTGHQPDDYWINNHQNTFARAWLLGVWRVEETGEVVKL